MTFILLCAGALVTGTGSGLAVPDWPLSFGGFFPPMVGGVFFEHGHRLIAGLVALLTVGLSLLLFRLDTRKWVQMLGVAAVSAILLQAFLGGMTVLFRLPRAVSIAHACLAQLFFSLTVVISVVTSRSWSRSVLGDRNGKRSLLVTFLSLATFCAFFIQLILGATLRHHGAGLAIPDFPTVFGGLLPPVFDFKIAIHFAHRLGALTVILLTAVLSILIYHRHPASLNIIIWVGLLVATVIVQFMLGAMVILLRRPLPVTTAHLAFGALCLAWSVVIVLETFRYRQIEPEPSFQEGSKS